MRNEEVQVGDYVLLREEGTLVPSIVCLTKQLIDNCIQDCEPLVITEDILLSNGFTKIPANSSVRADIYTHDSADETITVVPSESYGSRVTMKEYVRQENLMFPYENIIGVHELQHFIRSNMKQPIDLKLKEGKLPIEKCGVFFISNTVNESQSSISGYFRTYKEALDALSKCYDWYRPSGTGRIYFKEFGLDKHEELLYEVD